MYSKRSLLRKITHQLIYLIVVASLVALSLKAISKEPVQFTDYLINKSFRKQCNLNITNVIYHLTSTGVKKKLRNDN